MYSRLFDEDPLGGTRTIFHFDPETEAITLETQSDVTAAVEANRWLHNQYDERANWKGDIHRVASIPMALYYDLKAKGIIDDEKALSKWLNDSENRFFRTRPGRV